MRRVGAEIRIWRFRYCSAEAGEIGPLQKRESRVARLRVANAHAAGMFALNIQSWQHLPFVRANYATEEIQALEE